MPSGTDRFDGANCYVIVNPSRKKFHLYGNDPAEISILDIANAISKQCRFTGHLTLDAWYSVAEHCLMVAEIIRLMGLPVEDQFAALMHDTPEAYLADIAAPFKREIGAYYEKEELVWRRIAAKYGIPEKLSPAIKAADWIALFIEARHLVVPGQEDILHGWVGWDEYGEESKEFDIVPRCLGFKEAREKWLAMFEALGGYAQQEHAA